MILTVLISNDRVSFALFDGKSEPSKASPMATVELTARPARTADEYAASLSAMLAPQTNGESIALCILASVVPALTDVIQNAVHRLYPSLSCLTVGAGLRTGLTLRTDAPAELGADLVALASGALAMQAPPLLVLDCNDVTTVSAVGLGKNGPEFLGCAILPGPNLGADALKRHAAQLPSVAVAKPERAIGGNTAESLCAGLYWSYAAALERITVLFDAEMGGQLLPAVVTGACIDPSVFQSCGRPFTVSAHLAHVGLYRLALLNVAKSGKAPKRV